MANKSYYYVLVFTNGGPVFVTSVEYGPKISHWNKDKEPKLFTMHNAEDLTFGLRCNGYQAVVVKSAVEIDYQPYNYEDWECTFVERKKDDDT